MLSIQTDKQGKVSLYWRLGRFIFFWGTEGIHANRSKKTEICAWLCVCLVGLFRRWKAVCDGGGNNLGGHLLGCTVDRTTGQVRMNREAWVAGYTACSLVLERVKRFRERRRKNRSSLKRLQFFARFRFVWDFKSVLCNKHYKFSVREIQR